MVKFSTVEAMLLFQCEKTQRRVLICWGPGRNDNQHRYSKSLLEWQTVRLVGHILLLNEKTSEMVVTTDFAFQ